MAKSKRGLNALEVLRGMGHLTWVFWRLLHHRAPGIALLLPVFVVLEASIHYPQSYLIGVMFQNLSELVGDNTPGAGTWALLSVSAVLTLYIGAQWIGAFRTFLTNVAHQQFRVVLETLPPKVYAVLGLSAFDRNNPQNQLLQRAEDGIYNARFYLPRVFDMLVGVLMTLVGYVVVLSLSWVSALVMIIPAVMVMWFNIKAGMRNIAEERSWWNVQGEITDIRKAFGVRDNFIGLALFRMCSYFIGLMDFNASRIATSKTRLHRREILETSLVLAVFLVSLGAALYPPFLGLAAGKMEVKTFVFLLFSMQGFVLGIDRFTRIAADQIYTLDKMLDLVRVVSLSEKLGANTENTSDADVKSGELERTAKPAGIELRNVSFRYAPDTPWIFRDLSLSIPHGTWLVVAGPNGSGKSTLLLLLAGLLKPESGSIVLRGFQTDDNGSLGKWMQLVPQVPLRLEVSVRDLLSAACTQAFGKSLPDEELIQALEFVGLWEKFSSGNGLDTNIGKRGVYISGGQAQRLFIAAGYLSLKHASPRPVVFGLDEPYNNVDPPSAKRIDDEFRAQAGHRQAMGWIVTHFEQSIRRDDRVLFIHQPDPTAPAEVLLGTHQALKETNRDYSKHWTTIHSASAK